MSSQRKVMTMCIGNATGYGQTPNAVPIQRIAGRVGGVSSGDDATLPGHLSLREGKVPQP